MQPCLNPRVAFPLYVNPQCGVSMCSLHFICVGSDVINESITITHKNLLKRVIIISQKVLYFFYVFIPLRSFCSLILLNVVSHNDVLIALYLSILMWQMSPSQ